MRTTKKDWPPFLAVTSKKIVLVDQKEQYTVFRSDDMLYGLTWDADAGRLYVSTRHDAGAGKTSEILVLDESMKLLHTLSVEDLGRDVHQLYFLNGRLYVCNTDRACVVEYNTHTHDQFEIRWTHQDTHLNCVWQYGSCFYALEHNHEHSPKNIVMFDKFWRLGRKIPIETGTQQRETGFGVHNIFILGNCYMTLGPYEVYTVEVDPEERGHTRSYQLEGTAPGQDYLRGLAAVPGKYLLIGSSPLTPRSHRGEGDSKVFLTDYQLNVLDMIVLKDVGQVCTLRLLSGDIAHNMATCPYQPTWT